MLAGGCKAISRHSADFGGFESCAGDAGFLDRLADFDEAGKLEATAEAPEFANFARQLLLAFDPSMIDGGRESGNAGPSQRRRGVSAQEFADSVELEDGCRAVKERLGSHLRYVTRADELRWMLVARCCGGLRGRLSG